MRPTILLGLLLLASCATPRAASPGDQPLNAFWSSLEAQCGKAFEGKLTVGTEKSDQEIGAKALSMSVGPCSPEEIRIPFRVGEDASRTWILTRSGGLRLKHQHLHADGTEDRLSGYGGPARQGGTSHRWEFPADSYTTQLIPAAATNVWALEVSPAQVFAYELRRVEAGRHFRVEFDLNKPLLAR